MIGLLPGLGTTLGDLEASGQLERCLVEWRAYAWAFGGARWFGYGPETAVFTVSGADSASRTHDQPPPGCSWLEALSKSRWVPVRLWPILMPLLAEFRRCRVLRVLNLTGALPALIAGRRWGIPWVLQVGYDAPAVAKAHGKPKRAAFLRQLQDGLVKRATGVIYASTALWEADYRRGLHKPGRDTVIPNGVDLRHFRYLWRCPPGKRRVVYVGRLSPEKNLDLLAAACQRVGATLHCFGTGPLAPRLAALPGVTCYGPVPHYSLPGILASFDAFCLPSTTEGSCKAVLEAMAVGLPCIAARGLLEGGSPRLGHPLDGRDEIVRWSHVWFKPGEGDDLAATLTEVLDNRNFASVLSWGGRRWVEARHDLKKTLADEVAFVHNAVEAHGQSARQA